MHKQWPAILDAIRRSPRLFRSQKWEKDSRRIEAFDATRGGLEARTAPSTSRGRPRPPEAKVTPSSDAELFATEGSLATLSSSTIQIVVHRLL
mmetsp:Transcript_8838/g.33376  ORF Transcript_8838/g.33376 Transcript_8838/m.33376 type:complete len:93 (+) Transcript_8838:437-715(+)